MQKSMIHSDHMVPLDTLEGFRIRPGFFDINGATALSDGVCSVSYTHLIKNKYSPFFPSEKNLFKCAFGSNT